MPRPRPEDTSDAGQDSFLDVVTNIVGILIILVMVVGGRVQQLVVAPPKPSAAPPSDRDLEGLHMKAASAESDVAELQSQARTVATAAAYAAQARLELATAVSATKAGLERRRLEGDAARIAAAELDTRRQRLESEIDRLTREAEAVAQAPPTTQEVLAYPTPIGRTVNGEELHFRLAGGRIAYIPLEELFELAKRQTQRHSGSIADMASRIESVGPEQGFGLDYVIEVKIDQARGQVLVRSREWVVRPAGQEIGEPVEEAMASGSRFRQVLAAARPGATVTLWCYPDTFAGYRRVREELHRLGIPTAGRPMPEGAPIGGSTEGSKSVVQ